MRQKAKKNWLSTAVVVDFVLHLYCFGGWKDARAHKVALIYALQPDTSFDHETMGLVHRVVCPFTSTVFAVVPVFMEEWPGSIDVNGLLHTGINGRSPIRVLTGPDVE